MRRRGRGAPVEEAPVVLAARAQRQEVLQWSPQSRVNIGRGTGTSAGGVAHLCCLWDGLAEHFDL